MDFLADGWEKEFSKLTSKHGSSPRSDHFWKLIHRLDALLSKLDLDTAKALHPAMIRILRVYDAKQCELDLLPTAKKGVFKVFEVNGRSRKLFVTGSAEDIVYTLTLLHNPKATG